ncbi:MAG TPA: glycosyltransferase [Cryomorphaceae bacterium]|nr:glycosyltransferase [Cryomorphaceae bacterium]HCY24777.1 glycosyltransferase [Cryomorphaceae bacterium]
MFKLDLSIVIPLFNEEESLPELTDWIARVMERESFSYEIIFVNDGSTDDSWSVIEGLRQRNPNVKAISFRKNQGKSAGLNQGFKACTGEVVVTMDADLQDSPEELPELRRMILEDHYDLVSGWKQKRYDPITKTLPTKLFNAATRRISKIKLNDFNCGLKAYRLEVVQNVEIYGEMHRYIPFLAKNKGFDKIGEKVVQHQARKYGTTKFGLDRFVNGFLDLGTLAVMGKFGRRPMHFFGAAGSLMFLLSVALLAYLGGFKLYLLSQGMEVRLITENPLFYILLTLTILGVQLFAVGFMAELLLRVSTKKHDYTVDAKIGLD